MKVTFEKVKKGTVISLAVLGVASILATFIRYRIVKRMIKKREEEVTEEVSE